MDLSFRFDRDAAATAIAGPFVAPITVLRASTAVRQATSPTARLQLWLDRRAPAHGLLAPPHGAFNPGVEAALRRWQRQ